MKNERKPAISRREFLKVSAAFAGGAVLAACGGTPKTEVPTNPPKPISDPTETAGNIYVTPEVTSTKIPEKQVVVQTVTSTPKPPECLVKSEEVLFSQGYDAGRTVVALTRGSVEEGTGLEGAFSGNVPLIDIESQISDRLTKIYNSDPKGDIVKKVIVTNIDEDLNDAYDRVQEEIIKDAENTLKIQNFPFEVVGYQEELKNDLGGEGTLLVSAHPGVIGGGFEIGVWKNAHLSQDAKGFQINGVLMDFEKRSDGTTSMYEIPDQLTYGVTRIARVNGCPKAIAQVVDDQKVNAVYSETDQKWLLAKDLVAYVPEVPESVRALVNEMGYPAEEAIYYQIKNVEFNGKTYQSLVHVDPGSGKERIDAMYTENLSQWYRGLYYEVPGVENAGGFVVDFVTNTGRRVGFTDFEKGPKDFYEQTLIMIIKQTNGKYGSTPGALQQYLNFHNGIIPDFSYPVVSHDSILRSPPYVEPSQPVPLDLKKPMFIGSASQPPKGGEPLKLGDLRFWRSFSVENGQLKYVQTNAFDSDWGDGSTTIDLIPAASLNISLYTFFEASARIYESKNYPLERPKDFLSTIIAHSWDNVLPEDFVIKRNVFCIYNSTSGNYEYILIR